MNSKLTFGYEFSRDGDDFGWLVANVITPHFTGHNGMWVQWQDICDFAESLASFPIAIENPVNAEWGFTVQGDYFVITKISIAPSGLTGGLAARVTLANYYEPSNMCSTSFQTDYPSIELFRMQIQRMMDDRSGIAKLVGTASLT